MPMAVGLDDSRRFFPTEIFSQVKSTAILFSLLFSIPFLNVQPNCTRRGTGHRLNVQMYPGPFFLFLTSL